MESHGAADRIAVMIDADNTRPAYADEVLGEVAKYGDPTIRRVYGDWTNPHLTQWARKLNRLGLRAMHQNAYTSGKNSTDLALVIDAMDLLYDGNVEAFALVTSDSDFTSLAHRLRESGKTVYGFGRRKTPEPLQNACDRFVFLENLSAAEPSTEEPAAPLPDLRTILTQAIDDTSADDGWSNLGGVGSVLGNRYPSFDSRSYGFPRLTALVEAQDYLDLVQSDHGSSRVRLRSSRPAKKAAARKRTAKKAQSG